MPLLRCRFPRGEEAPHHESEGIREPRPRRRNGGNRGEQDHGDPELPSSTVQALPVQVGPANPDGERTYQYWPFSTSDLYNWKTQRKPVGFFSEKPHGLTDLLDSILFTHSPTWMTLSSCCRCSSPQKNGSKSWQRRGNGSRGPTGGQMPSLISWMRGFLCCGLTGILSEQKVGSVSEGTARL